MRKITEQAVKAFIRREKFKSGNTQVVTAGNEAVLLLHGNAIAQSMQISRGQFAVYISDGGWQTVTTKERLNGLCYELLGQNMIQQKDFEWFFDGKKWDGSWMKVTGEAQ